MTDVITWLSSIDWWATIVEPYHIKFYVIIAIALVYFEWKFHSLRKWFIND